jgi:L-galactose dehydrogenase
VFFLHDVDFVDLDGILGESIPTLQQLKDEGLIRAYGTSGYGLGAAKRIIEEGGVDVVLNFSHGTLLDNTMDDVLGPPAQANDVGLVNAAAVALGALTPAVQTRADDTFLAPPGVLAAARAMVAVAQEHGVGISHLANQYAIQRSGAVTTVVGTTKLDHLRDAVAAADEPIDEELLAAVLAHRPDPATHQWDIGLPENR